MADRTRPPGATTSPALLLLCAVLFAACGGRSVGVVRDDDGQVISPPDGAVGPDGTVVIPEACSGPAWAAGLNQAPQPVTVTSSPIVMDCCDGATAHFHAGRSLGFDAVVMIRAWGAWPGPGTWDLGDLGPDAALEVRVDDPAGTGTFEQRLTGWLTLEPTGDPWTDPVRLSVCVMAIAEDPEVQGVRLWVGDLPVMPWSWYDRFALHLLEDPSLTAAQAADRPLGDLVLDPEPVVTLGNLAWYERATHTLRFDPWYGDRLRGLLPQVGVGGLPFVVVVDGAPVYLGAFYTSLSSQSFGGPVIVVEDIAEGAARIDRAYPGPGAASGPDPRGDPRLFELLEAAAKLAP